VFAGACAICDGVIPFVATLTVVPDEVKPVPTVSKQLP
jgi:hypothetical protein